MFVVRGRGRFGVCVGKITKHSWDMTYTLCGTPCRHLLAGGLGKTTLAAALVRDTEVRRHSDRVAFIPAGQEPAVLELQRSAYSQLVGKQLEAKPDATVASQRVCLPFSFV